MSHGGQWGRRDSNPRRASFFIQFTAAQLTSLAVPVIEHQLSVRLKRLAVKPLHHAPEYGRGIRFNLCRSHMACSPVSSTKRIRTFASALSEELNEPLDERAMLCAHPVRKSG